MGQKPEMVLKVEHKDSEVMLKDWAMWKMGYLSPVEVLVQTSKGVFRVGAANLSLK